VDNDVIETKIFRDNLGCKVILETTRDGKRYVRKTYGINNVSLNNVPLDDEEWDALCFFYDAGLNVPKPYKKDENGIYMQYIDNGMFLDAYKTAGIAAKSKLTERFVKLLYDLHEIKPQHDAPPGGFIKNELAEIKTIIVKKQADRYWRIFNKLESLSADIDERPPCYIHRDYHIWNVLSDKNEKLYLIDMALTQGDYRFDIGWTYMLMNRSAIYDAGYAAFAQAFLTGYYKLKPNARENMDYFKQLANLRWLVNVSPENKADKPWFPEMTAIAEQAADDFLRC